MKKTFYLLGLSFIVISIVLSACAPAATEAPAAPVATEAPAAPAAPAAPQERKTLRIAMIPTVVHPWFYDVYQGGIEQAEFLSSQLPYDIKVEYYAPDKPDISVQIGLIEQVAATNPDGMIICPLDVTALTPLVKELQGEVSQVAH